jgi:hypothetical protein
MQRQDNARSTQRCGLLELCDAQLHGAVRRQEPQPDWIFFLHGTEQNCINLIRTGKCPAAQSELELEIRHRNKNHFLWPTAIVTVWQSWFGDLLELNTLVQSDAELATNLSRKPCCQKAVALNFLRERLCLYPTLAAHFVGKTSSTPLGFFPGMRNRHQQQARQGSQEIECIR